MQYTIQRYWSCLKVSPLRLLIALTCQFYLRGGRVSLHFFHLDQCFVSLIIANVEKSNISVFFLSVAWVLRVRSLWFPVVTPKAARSGLRTIAFGAMLVVSWIFYFTFSSISWLLQPWLPFLHQKRKLDRYFVVLTVKLAMNWAQAWTKWHSEVSFTLDYSVINCNCDFSTSRGRMQLTLDS